MSTRNNLIALKRKCASSINQNNNNQAKLTVKTGKDRHISKPALITRTSKNQKIRVDFKKSAFNPPKSNLIRPIIHKKLCISHIIPEESNIDLLIKVYRKKMRCSGTLIIDTRGNNNLNMNPNNINSINQNQFEQLIIKGIGQINDKVNSLFTNDTTIFTESEKRKIDSIIPFDEIPQEEGRENTDSVSLQSYDQLTDLQDDAHDNGIKIYSFPISSAPTSFIINY